MVSPSGLNRNYLLFHFNGIDSNFQHSQIKLFVNARVNDLVLTLDDKGDETFVGKMFNTKFRSLKKIIVSHYNISKCRFNFDTSYFFNTLPANKAKNKNPVEEYFMAIPGKGFMLLKKYGRPWNSAYSNEEIRYDDREALVFWKINKTLFFKKHGNYHQMNLRSLMKKYAKRFAIIRL